MPTSSTPMFCMVSGTGVKGSGTVIRAQSATSRLAPTTRAILRSHSEERTAPKACEFSSLAMFQISYVTSKCIILACSARVLVVARLGASIRAGGFASGRFHVTADADDRGDGRTYH